jgi:hypothetical protein
MKLSAAAVMMQRPARGAIWAVFEWRLIGERGLVADAAYAAPADAEYNRRVTRHSRLQRPLLRSDPWVNSKGTMTTHAKETIGGISVYVPIGESDTQSKKLAPRLESLRGARIGILDNHKEFADLVLQGVVDVLKRDFGVADVTVWQKSYLGVPSPYAREMAASCDAVINGVGH